MIKLTVLGEVSEVILGLGGRSLNQCLQHFRDSDSVFCYRQSDRGLNQCLQHFS